MKNRFMRGAALGLAMVTAFTFTAPNSALLSAEAAAKQATAATKITAKAASVKVGKTAKVKVTINKKATKKVTINVKAKNAKIAKVAKKLTIKKGKKAATLKVKGLKKGSTKLTLSFKNSKGKTVKKTIKVTVKKAAAAKVAATGVTFGKDAYSVGMGQTTTLDYTVVPANTTDTATWTSSDETVATVANGVVTGVKEGKATITVTFNENVTASAEVVVSKEAIIYNLTAVKQVAANKVELTFDNVEAKNLTQKTDIYVNNAATTLRHHVNDFTWNAEGNVAVAEVATPFADKTDYNVTFKNGTPIAFTASVGEVSSIVLKTTTAEAEKATVIEYSMLDANGIDVISTVNVNSKVSISKSGKGTLGNTSKKLKTTIKMTTVGDTADITITYKPGSGKSNIEGKGTITCVDSQAEVGTGIFKVTKNINTDSNCAKFYLDESGDSIVTLATNDSTESNVYFYAKNEDGKAIDYKKYEVSSSDTGVMSVKTSGSYTKGKFLKLEITPKKEGSANVIITATSVGNKTTPYSIPVEVVEKATLSSIELDVDKETISNVYDAEYYGEITVKGYDTLGREMDLTSATMELSDSDSTVGVLNNATALKSPYSTTKTKGAADVESGKAGFMYSTNKTFTSPVFKGTTSGTQVTNDDGTKVIKFYYNAWGAAKADTLNFTIKAKAGSTTVENDTDITIEKIDDALWTNLSGTSASSITYAIEVGKEEYDLTDFAATNKIRLYAENNGTFAGYVRHANGSVTNDAAKIGGAETGATADVLSGGAVTPNTTDQITNIRYAVQGTSSGWTKPVGNSFVVPIYDSYTNVNTEKAVAIPAEAVAGTTCRSGFAAEMDVDAINDGGTTLTYAIGGDAESAFDEDFALQGTYTARFEYEQNGSDKDLEATFSVVSTMNQYAPTVGYTELNLDSLSASKVKDVLYTNVSMNASDENKAIGTNMYTFAEDSNGKYTLADQFKASGTSDGKFEVDYVTIKESVNTHPSQAAGTPVNFLVFLGQTFTKN